MPGEPLEYKAMEGLVLLAVRMRRKQIESANGTYNAHCYAAMMEAQRHFDQHAREILGDAGDVRQPVNRR
jgi:hypothetical protein